MVRSMARGMVSPAGGATRAGCATFSAFGLYTRLGLVLVSAMSAYFDVERRSFLPCDLVVLGSFGLFTFLTFTVGFWGCFFSCPFFSASCRSRRIVFIRA